MVTLKHNESHVVQYTCPTDSGDIVSGSQRDLVGKDMTTLEYLETRVMSGKARITSMYQHLVDGGIGALVASGFKGLSNGVHGFLQLLGMDGIIVKVVLVVLGVMAMRIGDKRIQIAAFAGMALVAFSMIPTAAAHASGRGSFHALYVLYERKQNHPLYDTRPLARSSARPPDRVAR
jgi:hypothetical protein